MLFRIHDIPDFMQSVCIFMNIFNSKLAKLKLAIEYPDLYPQNTVCEKDKKCCWIRKAEGNIILVSRLELGPFTDLQTNEEILKTA